jgi:hypothetical protein
MCSGDSFLSLHFGTQLQRKKVGHMHGHAELCATHSTHVAEVGPSARHTLSLRASDPSYRRGCYTAGKHGGAPLAANCTLLRPKKMLTKPVSSPRLPPNLPLLKRAAKGPRDGRNSATVPSHRIVNNDGKATHTRLEEPPWQDLECFRGPLVDTRTGAVRSDCCAAEGMHCSFVLMSTDGAVQAALGFVANEARLPTSGTHVESGFEATLACTLQLHADRLGLQSWDGAASTCMVQSGHAVPPLSACQVARLRAALPELWLTGSLASRFLQMLKRVQRGCTCAAATPSSPTAICSCTEQWRARQLCAAQRGKHHACGLTHGREVLLLKEGILSPLKPQSTSPPVAWSHGPRQ